MKPSDLADAQRRLGFQSVKAFAKALDVDQERLSRLLAGEVKIRGYIALAVAALITGLTPYKAGRRWPRTSIKAEDWRHIYQSPLSKVSRK